MSNPNPDFVLDEADTNRSSQQPISNPTTKKKSGFQITSVTDSGHGRPASIVRDGEESADDLDESHASYSDISYSRATDVDHDQESTASEDTLNISAHEGAGAHSDSGHVNHYAAIHHPHSQQPIAGQLNLHDNANASGKPSVHKDIGHDTKKVHYITPNVPSNVSKDSMLHKQQSEHLESPQELPHDNATSAFQKVKKAVDSDKVNESSLQKPASITKVPPQDGINTLEQHTKHTATVSSSNVPASSQSVQKVSADSSEVASADRSSAQIATPVTSSTTITKPVSVPSTVTGVKAPGTRVYKVVKRETAHPTKRIRGRWNWYDFSDTQAPMTGVAQSVGEPRITCDAASIHTFSYTNTLMSPSVVPYTLQPSDSASSLLKAQLYSAGFPSNNSSSAIGWEKSDGRDGPLMALAPELRTAMMKKYVKTSGDPSTGDMSVSARTLKIDNKIEAAMDLVKKHLMSAVRDEVDELKEKIKDLTEETNRLKNENKELRAALPADVLSQVQASIISSKDSLKESIQTSESSNTTADGQSIQSSSSTSFEHSSQKGISGLPQDVINPSYAGFPRPSDGKVKMPAAALNSAHHSRQDATKVSIAKSSGIVGHLPNIGQPHVQPSNMVPQPNVIPVQQPNMIPVQLSNTIPVQPNVISKAMQQPGASLHQQPVLSPSSQQNISVDQKLEPNAQMSHENLKNPAKNRHDTNFEKKNPS